MRIKLRATRVGLAFRFSMVRTAVVIVSVRGRAGASVVHSGHVMVVVMGALLLVEVIDRGLLNAAAYHTPEHLVWPVLMV